MAELKLEQLSKVFGDQTVVRDLNLTIPQGRSLRYWGRVAAVKRRRYAFWQGLRS